MMRRARHWLAMRPSLTPYLLLAPLVSVLLVVAFWPLARTIFYSFTDAFLDDIDNYSMVGFSNYAEVLKDKAWWIAVQNTSIFTVISVSLETVIGLSIALLVNQAMPGRGLVRAAILVPWAIPVVVSAKIWEWMLHDQFGVINRILLKFGVIEEGIAWTVSGVYLMGSIIAIDVWMTTPFMVLLILAGLQMIPEEINEAASVDGIPWWKKFWSLTLPLLLPTLGVAILFRTLDALRMFDLSYVLAGRNKDAMTMSIYARDRLVSFLELGIGSAASTLVFLVVGLAGVLIIGLFRLDRTSQS